LLLCYLIKPNTNIMEKKLKRSRNQIIAGVCAGFADYIGWDVTLVRAIYALLSILSVGFPGVVLYIILWLIMPLEGDEI
jgi:phage shock protein C